MSIGDNILSAELLQRIFNKESSNKKSIVDYTNPETFGIAYRIREGLECIRHEAENNVIKKTIVEEFGKELPTIESKVFDKIFNPED